jgi:hypothetical protein
LKYKYLAKSLSSIIMEMRQKAEKAIIPHQCGTIPTTEFISVQKCARTQKLDKIVPIFAHPAPLRHAKGI